MADYFMESNKYLGLLVKYQIVAQNYIIYLSAKGTQNSVNHSLLAIRTKGDTGWSLCDVFHTNNHKTLFI
jgi:hypothetical protein